MANSDTPRGLQPVRHVSSGYYDGAVNKYFVPASDATAIYKGGLVKLAGDADADGIPTVTGNVATGDTVVGVVVAVEPVDRSSTIYREASTDRYVSVMDDPNAMFEVQADAAVTTAQMGNVADLASFTSGVATTGLSSMEVAMATATNAGDGTEDVLILRAAPREENDVDTNAKLWVRLNNHAFANGNTGA